jgi:3-isopropylmalate/(R)-2-methylmalate dehydratase small subunit
MDPETELVIDLEAQTVRTTGLESVNFPIDEFSKRCLLDGVDEMGYILKNEGEIRLYEKSHSPRVHITSIE